MARPNRVCTEPTCCAARWPRVRAAEALEAIGQDVMAGYSPERINPGDKERTVTKITK